MVRMFTHKVATIGCMHRVYSTCKCEPIASIESVLFDHPQSGVVCNFGRVCVYVCQTITFESLAVRSSHFHMRHISAEYGSSSYMKVIGSRSRLQEPKMSQIPMPPM